MDIQNISTTEQDLLLGLVNRELVTCRTKALVNGSYHLTITVLESLKKKTEEAK